MNSITNTAGGGDAPGWDVAVPARPEPWLRPMAALSFKLSLAMLAPIVMSLYVARLVAAQGDLVFSAYSIVTSTNTALFIVISSFLQVLYFLGGRAKGVGDEAGYRAAIRAGFQVALVMGVAATAVSAATGPLLLALGFEDSLVAMVQWQGLVAALGLLPPVLLVVYRVHASLNVRAGFVTAVAALGAVGGTVLATLAARASGADAAGTTRYVLLSLAVINWLMLLVTWVGLRSLTPRADAVPSVLRGTPAKSAWREMWSYGWPIGAVVLMDSALTLSSTLAMGRWWVEVLPVHSVVVLWMALGLIVPLGIAQAGVQHVSIAHARGDVGMRNRAAAAALLLGGLYGLVSAVLLATFAVPAGALLLPDAEMSGGTQAQLRQLMLPGGIVLAAEGVIVIAAALLRGIGQTRTPIVYALAGYAVFGGCGQALFASHFGLGAVGLWWGLVLGFGATAVAVTSHCIVQLGMHRRPARDVSLTSPLNERT